MERNTFYDRDADRPGSFFASGEPSGAIVCGMIFLGGLTAATVLNMAGSRLLAII